MPGPSDPGQDRSHLRRKLIGLGEKSLRKSYFPALQERLAELERFRALLDQSTEAVLLVEAVDLKVADCNQAAARLLGRGVEELRGESLRGLLQCPESSPLAFLLQDPAAVGDQSAGGVCRCPGPDGGGVPAEFTANRVVFDGKPYLVLVGRDITQRLRDEEALRGYDAKLRLLAENVTDVIWVMELADMTFSYVSPSIQVMQSYRPEEFLGLTPAHILTPHSLNLVLTVLQEELARDGGPEADPGRGRTMELENLRKGGGTVWVEATCRFLRDPEGKPTAVVGVSRDISERRQARERLRQSEERYRLILEASPDPVVMYDMEGRVQYLNPAFTRVFGWTLEELLGRRIDYVPQEDWPRTREMLELIKRGQASSGFETRRLTKGGDTLDVALSWSVWPDEMGRPAGSVVVARDTTEHRKLQAQLERARRMEAIGALAGGVAHDLNNVLQAVSGNVQLLLLKAALEPAARKQLADMDRLIQRAAETIGQLLTLSRGKSARREPVDLNREIDQVCRLLVRVIPRMIALELDLDPDLRPILGDPAQIEQVVLNLATNAVDAMPQGGSLVIATANVDLDEIFCRAHPHLSPGPHALVQVTDTGHGMDSRTLEQIFDPFFTTKQAGKGTGLGLATVYSMVKGHQGMIYCYSRPGQGTVFKIYLPAAGGVAAYDASGPSPSPETSGGGETVLIVDDEPSILAIGREMLDLFGYRVLQAASGEEALDICRSRPGEVDLVILDLNMPGMGGFRCLEELLSLQPAPRVVISSGYRTEAMARDLAAAGAAGFMDKPYRLNDMILKIRDVLGDGQRPD